MTENQPAPGPAAGVSPQRKKISTIILVVLLVVAAIEIRASLGQRWSVEALAAISDNGVFENKSHEEIRGMLALAPSKSTSYEGDTETEYEYSWLSLLRPGKMKLFVVANKAETEMATRFTTEAIERKPPVAPMENTDDGLGGMGGGGAPSHDAFPSAGGGPGGEGPGGGEGGGEGGRTRPPMEDEGDEEAAAPAADDAAAADAAPAADSQPAPSEETAEPAPQDGDE